MEQGRRKKGKSRKSKERVREGETKNKQTQLIKYTHVYLYYFVNNKIVYRNIETDETNVREIDR